MTTINLQVGAGADDGFKYDASWTSVDTALDMGEYNTNSRSSWMRFAGVTIAQGATIDVATLTFTARLSQSGATVNLTIQGEDADNATQVTSAADYNGRAKTTASVAWNAVAAWTAESTYSPADLKTIIQEIINRGGWSSGNAVSIFVQDNASSASAFRPGYSYDGSTTKAPKLDITYTAPIAAVSMDHYRRRRT